MTDTMTMPGSGYRATRSADGVLTVHDVPIFVECSRGEHEFDGDWIKQAVEKAQGSAAEGYLPPLHVRHHEDGVDVKPAGFFRITGTDRIRFKGEKRLAVLADLVITDPVVAAEVLAKRYPYRSVEIFNVTQPAFDSLALLDHEAPFLELPMLMVSRVEKTDGNVPGGTFAASSAATFRAIFRRGSSAALLFNMDDQTTTTTTPAAATGAAPAMDAQAAVAAVLDAIKAGKLPADVIASLCDALKDQMAAVSPLTMGSDDPAKAPSPGAGRASMKREDGDSELRVQMARMAGELEAEKAKAAEFRAEIARKEQVAVALKRLDGRPLGADLEQKLAAFHKAYGEAAFAAYVEAFATSVGPLVKDNSQVIALKAAEKAPTVAMKYEAQGPDAVRQAMRFSQEWDELSAHGAVRVTKERYVEIHMGLATRNN